MKVLVACERSGTVRDAFIEKGHDAISCDLFPSDKPGPHYQGDIFDILYTEKWDLIIAHPPCTYLCNSGALWLYNKDKSRNEARWEDMCKGALFFKSILNADCDKICIENPIQHRHATEIIGSKYTQIVRPFQYGENSTKATCLWLKGLEPLIPTDIIIPEKHITKSGKSYDKWWFDTCLISDLTERAKARSKTFKGIANAMAEQWG